MVNWSKRVTIPMVIIRRPGPHILVARYYPITWGIAAIMILFTAIGPQDPTVWLTVKIPLTLFAVALVFSGKIETRTFDKSDNIVTFEQKAYSIGRRLRGPDDYNQSRSMCALWLVCQNLPRTLYGHRR